MRRQLGRLQHDPTSPLKPRFSPGFRQPTNPPTHLCPAPSSSPDTTLPPSPSPSPPHPALPLARRPSPVALSTSVAVFLWLRPQRQCISTRRGLSQYDVILIAQIDESHAFTRPMPPVASSKMEAKKGFTVTIQAHRRGDAPCSPAWPFGGWLTLFSFIQKARGPTGSRAFMATLHPEVFVIFAGMKRCTARLPNYTLRLDQPLSSLAPITTWYTPELEAIANTVCQPLNHILRATHSGRGQSTPGYPPATYSRTLNYTEPHHQTLATHPPPP